MYQQPVLQNPQMLLKEFKIHLDTNLGKAPQTGVSYCSHARQYIDFFYFSHDAAAPLTISQDLFESFIGWLRENKYAEATVEARAYGVYRFWKFLYKKKKMAPAPEPFEFMEINFHKEPNFAKPISRNEFFTLIGDLNEVLRSIW